MSASHWDGVDGEDDGAAEVTVLGEGEEEECGPCMHDVLFTQYRVGIWHRDDAESRVASRMR